MARTYHIFDVIIVGCGFSALAALEEARKYTENVLLIYDDAHTQEYPLYTGSMPSKLLMQTAQLYHTRHVMSEWGIKGSEYLYLDMNTVLEKAKKNLADLIQHSKKSIKNYDSYIITGKYKFELPTKIRVSGKLFHARKVVWAETSYIRIPPELEPFPEAIITPEKLLQVKQLPRRVAVLGLNLTGLEIAQTLSILGVEVVAIQDSKLLGDIHHEEIQKNLFAILRQTMEIWPQGKLTFAKNGSSYIISNGKQTREVEAICPTGVHLPVIHDTGLQKLFSSYEPNGMPAYNRTTLQMEDSDMYTAGDPDHNRYSIQEMQSDGIRAVYNALHPDHIMKPYPVLRILHTTPNVAAIGHTSDRGMADRIVIGEADLSKTYNMVIESQKNQKLVIYTDKKTKKIVGAEVLTERGEHHAHLLALAIANELTVEQILEMPFYIPAYEEKIKNALLSAQHSLSKGGVTR
jgi:dihydrolipoamide dehydrogenase